MVENLTKKDKEKLRKEREELFSQAEVFLAEEDYDIVPELFFQISVISNKLGEDDIAKEFVERSEQIRALILSSDAPIEPEIIEGPPQSPIPPWSPPNPPLFAPPATSPVVPPIAPPTPLVPPSAPPPSIGPTTPAAIPKKIMDPITSKLQELKSLVSSLTIPKSLAKSAPPASKTSPAVAPPITPPNPLPAFPIAAKPPAVPPAEAVTSPSTQILSKDIDSLISQRHTEQGTELESGIVPTVVRDEEEIIREILNEKVPYMPDNDKENAIEKLLTYPPGVQRDAWLKVFLIKNKRYAKKII